MYIKNETVQIINVLLFQIPFAPICRQSRDTVRQHKHVTILQHATLLHNKSLPVTRRTSVFGLALKSPGPAGEGVAPILVLRVT